MTELVFNVQATKEIDTATFQPKVVVRMDLPLELAEDAKTKYGKAAFADMLGNAILDTIARIGND